jgi:subtilisin family serine protease
MKNPQKPFARRWVLVALPLFLVLLIGIGIALRSGERGIRPQATAAAPQPAAPAPAIAAAATPNIPAPAPALSQPQNANPTPPLIKVQNTAIPQMPGVQPDGVTLATVTRPSAQGVAETVRIVRKDGEKYPLIRVVEQKGKGEGAKTRRTAMVADHVMVRLQPGVTAEKVGAAIPQVPGLAVRDIVGKQGHALLTFSNANTDPDALTKTITALTARKDLVQYAEPDYVVTVKAVPNDTRYTDGSLWGLNNTGQSGGANDADVDAPEGWDIRTDASSVLVAVVDTGILTTHEDLAANMWVNPGETAGNGIDDDANGYIDDIHGINAITGSGDPTDDNRHGTHCAGTIGAVGNNGKGVAGVAWKVKLLGAKFLSGSGGGVTSDAVKCIQYASDRGAKVISNSWGGGGPSQAVLDCIQYAKGKGAVVVFAAGNDGENNDATPMYPANSEVENVVSVAATTRTDGIAAYSNYGRTYVNVGAPGSDIVSTVITSTTAYGSLSGTSMATPHVAGVLAMLAAEFPTDNYGQLINRLYRSVEPTAALATKVQTGGRVNLQKALATTTNRPANDDFETPFILSSGNFTFRTANLSATTQEAEPNHAAVPTTKTIWYRWTAPDTSSIVVSTLGSQIDTTIGVYTGASVDALTLVTSNDNTLTGTSSRVRISPVAGTTYHIAVGSKDDVEGLIMFTVGLAPANDDFVNSKLISGSSFSVDGSTLNASNELNEPLLVGEQSEATVWFTWTAPTSGTYVVTTQGGTNFDSLLGVYTGTSLATLQLIAENDDLHSEFFSSRVMINVTAGTTYRIVIGGKNGASGNYRLTIGQPPANDNFVNAITIANGTLPVTVTGHNRTASIEEGEPVIVAAGQPGGTSVWWKWTAPQSLDYTVDTVGSDYDTMLAVYRGTSVANLTQVAGNDDLSFGSLQSRVTMPAVAGVTYYIRVDGWVGRSGNITLKVSNAVRGWGNDDLADAIQLDGTDITTTGSNLGAFIEWPDAGPLGVETWLPDNTEPYPVHNSVWWTWTAPANGSVNLNFFDNEQRYYYVQVLRLTNPSQPLSYGNLTSHAYRTDIVGGGRNLGFPVVRGTRYFVRIGYNYNDQVSIGQFRFRINYTGGTLTSQPPRITNARLNATGTIDSSQTLGITSLTATDPQGSAITYSYQWQRSVDQLKWTDVSGATAATVVPQAGYFWRARIRPSNTNTDGVWFQTESIAVDAPPVLAGIRGQSYSYTSGLVVPAPHTLPRLPAFINEFSKGVSGKRRWIEILTQQRLDMREYQVKAMPGGAEIQFSEHAMWSDVPAGTLIVIYNGGDRDPALPADTLTVTNGVLVISDRNTTAFTYTHQDAFWINNLGDGDPNNPGGGRGVVLKNSRSSMFFRMGWAGDGGVGAMLPTFSPAFKTGQSLRQISGTPDAVEMQSAWEFATGDAADVSPARPNSLANQEYVDRLRAGASAARFRIATPIPDGLTFNPSTGTLSGVPTGAPGTIYPVAIERFNGYDSAIRSFDLRLLTELEAFRSLNGLAANGSQDLLPLAGDGIASLLKYAFNMMGTGTGQAANLYTPNAAVLSPTGNAGLPLITNVDGRLQVTFVRRKASTAPGISYRVEFTSAMDTWETNASAIETVESIDDNLERVTVTDSLIAPEQRFARVRVSIP